MRTPALFVTVAIAASVFAVPGSASARAKDCDSTESRSYTILVTVERGNTSCKDARRLMRDLYNGKGKQVGSGATAYRSIRGWRCDTGAGGGACIKNGKNYKTARDRVSAEIPPPS